MRDRLEKILLNKFFLAFNIVGICLGATFLIMLEIESDVYHSASESGSPDIAVIYDVIKEVEENEKYTATESIIEVNSSVYKTFLKAGISGGLIQRLVVAAKPAANLASVRPKTKFLFYWDKENEKELKKIEYPLNKIEDLVLFEKEGKWESRIHEKVVEIKIETYQGNVESSLWNSAISAGVSGSVITKMADIFAWQIDFSREIRNGDSWRISIERRYVKNTSIGWGNVVAAEFVNSGEKFVAIKYAPKTGRTSYFDPDGESLRKIFLKSPVRFSRITSGFSRRRMHPILKINRPHRGVDYGAARGTPVRSVGDGKISTATYRKASGNYIKISHNSKYSTSYHHLQKFARGVKKGKKVNQGDIIGYVGSTGLATGPHLHFAFYENGKYIDPLGLKFPSADPIAKSEREDYKKFASKALASLPAWKTPQSINAQNRGLLSKAIDDPNETTKTLNVR